MNKGMYEGKQVIPESVVNATMEPSIPEHNYSLDQCYTEIFETIEPAGPKPFVSVL